MNETFHRMAGAGNAAALIILILFLANANVMLEPAVDTAPNANPVALPPPNPSARTVVVVVIDGLRNDASRDRNVMPFVNSVAQRGGRGIATVESLIPSTVAGIVTLATGTVPAPVSFVNDFRSPAAEDGGVFDAVVSAGGTCFVAGPRLWTDLYGKWIAGSYIDTRFSGDDESVLDAALGAVRSGRYRLIVVHFGETDAAAHLHGGTAREYADAVRRCDEAVRRLHDATGPETSFVITSDHGVTDHGGHAGPEPEVLATPVIVAGPGMPRGELPPVRQRDVHRIVLHALGLETGDAGAAPATAKPIAARLPLLFTALTVGLLHCGMRMASRLERPEPFRHRYVGGINATIWICLALLLLAGPVPALVVAAAVVAAYAVGTRGSISPAVVAALAAGTFLGIGRLADGLPRGSFLSLVSFPPIAVYPTTLLLGFSLGAWMRRSDVTYRIGVLAGVLAVVIVAFSSRALGRTFSLSTIDTHHAFHAADGPAGIAGAVVLVLATEALPTVCLLAGLLRGIRRLNPSASGGFATGAAAALVGQALASAAALAATATSHHALASLALGGFLRVSCDTIYFFLLAAPLSLRRSNAAGAARP